MILFILGLLGHRTVAIECRACEEIVDANGSHVFGDVGCFDQSNTNKEDCGAAQYCNVNMVANLTLSGKSILACHL